MVAFFATTRGEVPKTKRFTLEPPLARSRLRLDRAALLTQEGNSPHLQVIYNT